MPTILMFFFFHGASGADAPIIVVKSRGMLSAKHTRRSRGR